MRLHGILWSGQTDRVRACVCVRVRHIFTYIKENTKKREKIAAVAVVVAAAATSSRNNKRQNDRLYFVSVFALLFNMLWLVDAFADIYVYQLITANK